MVLTEEDEMVVSCSYYHCSCNEKLEPAAINTKLLDQEVDSLTMGRIIWWCMSKSSFPYCVYVAGEEKAHGPTETRTEDPSQTVRVL